MNPGLLGEEHLCYLYAMQPPFCTKNLCHGPSSRRTKISDDPGEEEELKRRKKTDGHVTNLEKKSCNKVGPRKEKERNFLDSLSRLFLELSNTTKNFV